MKRTLFLIALILIWTGSVYAGELKVQIPVEDYTKIESRLKSLENENSRLKQEVQALETSSMATSPGPTTDNSQVNEEMKSRLSALERENNQLKQEVRSLQNTEAVPSSNDDIESRLSSLESENIRLNQQIKSYKDKGVVVLDNDRRTARQVFRDMRTK